MMEKNVRTLTQHNFLPVNSPPGGAARHLPATLPATLGPNGTPKGPNGPQCLIIQGKIRFFASRWPKPFQNQGFATFGTAGLGRRSDECKRDFTSRVLSKTRQPSL